MNLYEERLSQLLNVLKEFSPEKIFTYGSWTYGSATRDSDIDIVMITNPKIDTLEIKKKVALRLLESKYPYDLEPDIHVIPSDVFEYRRKRGDPFISNVVKGTLIYGSKTH